MSRCVRCADLRRRLKFAVDNVIEECPDPARRHDPRIKAMQVAVRDAREVLLRIAAATESSALIDLSQAMATAHDGLYSVNSELLHFRDAVSPPSSSSRESPR